MRAAGRFVFAAFVIPILAMVTGAGASAAADFDRNALIEGAKKEGKLVWYSAAPEQIVTAMLKNFSEKYPFIDVSEYFRQSAGRLQARWDAERDAGKFIPDVLHSGDISIVLTHRQHFDEFYTPEQDSYAGKYKDPGVWTCWRMTTLGLAVNPNKIPGAPDTWWVMADPKYAGKVGFQDSNAGMQMLSWLILRETLGEGFWEKVIENKPKLFTSTTPLAEAVLREEIWINGNATSYMNYTFEYKDKAPYKGIFPKEGVPISISPIMVVKNAPHPNAARLFVDWVLSKEGQTVMVRAYGDYSAREDVEPPAGAPALTNIKTLTIPSIQKLLDSRETFINEWKKIRK